LIQKPSNIFIDSEGNVRLGDFGLATTDRMNSSEKSKESSLLGKDIEEGEVLETEYMQNLKNITDSSNLMKGHLHDNKSRTHGNISASESITGGVGTTYYRAPEQALANRSRPSQKMDGYDVMVDIYSFGIVLFEMFHPPFQTGMERFNILSRLRCDEPKSFNKDAKEEKSSTEMTIEETPNQDKTFSLNKEDWKNEALKRFPSSFIDSTPENAQKMILWCLDFSPSKRPSAQDLLSVSITYNIDKYFSIFYKTLILCIMYAV